METRRLWRDFDALPVEAQKEAADFIEFLRRKYASLSAPPKKGAWTDEPSFGMWRDREDMKDSGAWVRTERSRHWSRLGDAKRTR